MEELPMGKQMQVDFREIVVNTKSGQRKGLYVGGFILSHSRFKYTEWLDRILDRLLHGGIKWFRSSHLVLKTAQIVIYLYLIY